MKKLIKWQLREYRSSVYTVFLGIWFCAAVAAWLSYTLLHLPLDRVVTVFRYVQWIIFLVMILTRYHEVDLQASTSTRDWRTLALHVPLPRWWGLVAKVLGLLPLLLVYLVINAVLFETLPPDLPRLAELSPRHALFRATGVILWGAVLLNVLIVRTRLTGVFLPSWRARFLEQLPKLRSIIYTGLDYVATMVLFGLCAVLVVGLLEVLLDSGLPISLQALIVATVGLLLTFVNGYLLEHHTPQIEPWG